MDAANSHYIPKYFGAQGYMLFCYKSLLFCGIFKKLSRFGCGSRSNSKSFFKYYRKRCERDKQIKAAPKQIKIKKIRCLLAKPAGIYRRVFAVSITGYYKIPKENLINTTWRFASKKRTQRFVYIKPAKGNLWSASLSGQ